MYWHISVTALHSPIASNDSCHWEQLGVRKGMNDQEHYPPLLAGTCVGTLYGPGVIVAVEPNKGEIADNSDHCIHAKYTVLLWRLPGQSLATATTAYLGRDAVRSE